MDEIKQDWIDHMKSEGFRFFVLKAEDFLNSLSNEEAILFNKMLHKHMEYRVSMNKTPSNEYWVVNKDDTPIKDIEEFLESVGAEHCINK